MGAIALWGVATVDSDGSRGVAQRGRRWTVNALLAAVLAGLVASCGSAGVGVSSINGSTHTGQGDSGRGVVTGASTITLISPGGDVVPIEARYAAVIEGDAYRLSGPVQGCYSDGGWQESVAAAGGGSVSLDLTDRLHWRGMAEVLSTNPVLVISIARRLEGRSAKSIRPTHDMHVGAAAVIAAAAAAAPASIRNRVRAAMDAAANRVQWPVALVVRTPRGHRIPTVVKFELRQDSPAGRELIAVQWLFTERMGARHPC